MKNKTILASLSLAIASYAHAGVYCVGNETELVNALTGAQSAGDDEINIRTGTYIGGFSLFYSSGSVVIRGGFTDIQCQIQDLNPLSTILDGGGQTRPFTIIPFGAAPQPSSTISISGLTFQNGQLNGGMGGGELTGGGMQAGTTSTPILTNVLIERNIFRGNRLNGVTGSTNVFGGGLAIAVTPASTFRVQNNLFANNSAPNAGAAFFHANPGGFPQSLFVTNNTFVNNQSTDSSLPLRVAVDYSGSGSKAFIANIFWNNGSGPSNPDINVDKSPDPTMLNNDIEFSFGAFSITSADNRSDNPQFINSNDPVNPNFRLKYGSPLINQGGQGSAGNYDLFGNARIDAGAIDIGAIETDYIFVDDFE